MSKANWKKEVRKLLQPYIHTYDEMKYNVLEDDVEDLISLAVAADYGEELLQAVKDRAGKGEEHQPNAFWRFFDVIPDGDYSK